MFSFLSKKPIDPYIIDNKGGSINDQTVLQENIPEETKPFERKGTLKK